MEKKFMGKHGIYYRLTLDFIVMGSHPYPLDRDLLTHAMSTTRGVFPETIVDGKFDTSYCRGSMKYIPYKPINNKKTHN